MAVDVVLVVILSYRMINNFSSIIDLIHAIVIGLDVNSDWARVGVVTYADNVTYIVALNQSIGQQSNLLEYLNFYAYGGASNMIAALRTMRQTVFTAANGARGAGVARQIAVLVGDGYSTVDAATTVGEAQSAKSAGIEMHSIVVVDASGDYDLATMTAISSDPTRFVYKLQTVSDIGAVSAALLGNICRT